MTIHRSPTPSSSRKRSHEAGYTLAALIVILTILAVTVAYTVPESWSAIMRRERDRETQFVMKQYARAIQEFSRRNGGLPVSLEQLEKQNQPRVLRRPYPNPLSGEMDWILVPQGQAQQPGQGQPGRGQQPRPIVNPQQGEPEPQQPPAGSGPSTPFPPSGGSRDYVGPFVGVRPPQTGEAVVPFNEKNRYEEWMYTVLDLQQERQGAAGGKPVVNPQQGQPTPPPQPQP